MDKNLKLYEEAKEKYYIGEPIMTDAEFDQLEDELRVKGLLNEYVGYKNLNEKHPHWNLMLSLNKIQVNESSDLEFQQILGKIKEFGKSVNISWKFDGAAISTQFKIFKHKETKILDCEIVNILTRGDGRHGISVLDKLSGKMIQIIANLITDEIITKPGEYELRGEVLMKRKVFLEKYSKEYANPRNYCSGLLNRKETEADEYKDLDVIVFDLLDRQGNHIDMKANAYEIETIEDIKTIYDEFHKQREAFQYSTDGLVIKAADMNRRKELGLDKTYPKFAIAIKFPAEIVTTKVKDLKYSILRSGEIGIVAVLEDVQLCGTNVKRANACNFDYCIEKGIVNGAKVRIRKAGDIIPQIIEVVDNKKTKEEIEIEILPKYCPACMSKLDTTDLLHVKCTNENCEGVLLAKFIASCSVFGIEYLGDALIERLFKEGKLREGYEIFLNDLPTLLKDSGKNLQKVQTQINEKKEIPLKTLILSLQIKDVGRTISQQLSLMYAGLSYDTHGLQKSTFEDFEKNYKEKVKEIIENLKIKGIEVIMPKEEKILEGGFTFEMTGNTPDRWKKKAEFVEYAKQFGGVHSGLNQDCKVLFCEDKNGNSTKLQKANKYGTLILNYDEIDNIKELL